MTDDLVGVGTKLLHSNELVNIWEVSLEPGQTHPWHHHRYPYLVVTIQGGRSRIDPRDGGDSLYVEPPAGSVVFDPGGIVHRITNIGDVPILDRLVEFKAAPPGIRPERTRVGVPDA